MSDAAERHAREDAAHAEARRLALLLPVEAPDPIRAQKRAREREIFEEGRQIALREQAEWSERQLALRAADRALLRDRLGAWVGDIARDARLFESLIDSCNDWGLVTAARDFALHARAMVTIANDLRRVLREAGVEWDFKGEII